MEAGKGLDGVGNEVAREEVERNREKNDEACQSVEEED